MKGKLYLLPSPLGENSSEIIFSKNINASVQSLFYFIVENEKSARKNIKFLIPDVVQSKLILKELNKRVQTNEIENYLDPIDDAISIGLLSDCGFPCLADPGSKIVRLAHKKNIEVVPICGGSSILTALISSGFNGQNFSFVGYLPISKKERKSKLKTLESNSKKYNQTQIFIETPYRNDALLLDIINILDPLTELSLAINIDSINQKILTKSISEWKEIKIKLHKLPVVFSIYNP